ncbi:hypothetical protein [Mesorhizobium sp.]|nr:hypothetical protein [Mesorhizobium sp.]RUV63511.1 hypothetical protein EOA64_08875 [Mesorhizobium sp. M1A.F.Ca.IN.022.02.1.1]RWG36203.1 MAG: hypothetical protein EOQ60_05040 [Mesorhizobium sp.]TIR00854.1 MAG: hypothetical protein E5X36_03745 [Mesorhizobium sp.]
MSNLDPALFKTTPEDRLRIKERTKQLITLAGGPGVFQHVAGVPTDMLSKYGSRSEPNFINAAVIIALDRALEAPLMVGELAAMLGYKLVPIEPDTPTAVGLEDLADVHKETSEVVTSLAAIVSGGTDIAARRRNAIREIDEGISSLYRARRKVAG